MAIYFVLVLSFFVFIGVIAARLLLSLFALKLGAQALTVGMLAATFSIFPMLLSVAAGKLTDRFGARLPVLLGTVGGACGMLIPYFIPGLPALFVAAAMNGVAFAFYSVALQNAVGLISSAEDRAQNFSNFSLMGSAVNLAGPLMVGWSIDNAGHENTCLYVALASLVAVVMLSFWGGVLPGGRPPEAGPAGDGFFKALTRPGVLKVLVVSSLAISGMDLFQFYMPVYCHSLGMSASAIGFILGMFAVAGVVVRVALKRLIKRHGENQVLAYAFFISAASFMLMPFFSGVAALSILSFAFGLGIGCSHPIITMLMFSHSAEGRTGETLGMRFTVNHMTRAVGPVIFGAVASVFGLFAVFWINAVMLAAGGKVSSGTK